MEASKLKVGVSVILTDADKKILLGKRKNVLGEGSWGLPGGHQKLGESIFECARREVFDEVNITIQSIKLVEVTEMVATGLDYQLIELGYSTNEWEGILELKEHKYCSEWKFFDLDELPENIFEPHQPIVEKMVQKLKNQEDEAKKNLYSYIYPHFKIAAETFVINSKGQLLMGLRKDDFDKDNWAVPGGHLDVGETLEECALRELEEETGLIATHAIQFASVEQPVTLSNKHYLHFGYLIKDIDTSALINGEPEDIERWEWFDLDEIPYNIALSQKEMILKFLKLNKKSLGKN